MSVRNCCPSTDGADVPHTLSCVTNSGGQPQVIEPAYLETLLAVDALRRLVNGNLDTISAQLQWFIESPAEESMRAAEMAANKLRHENATLRDHLRAMTTDRDAWQGMYRQLTAVAAKEAVATDDIISAARDFVKDHGDPVTQERFDHLRGLLTDDDLAGIAMAVHSPDSCYEDEGWTEDAFDKLFEHVDALTEAIEDAPHGLGCSLGSCYWNASTGEMKSEMHMYPCNCWKSKVRS